MAATEIEVRIKALEDEITDLKERVEKAIPPQRDWLNEIFGVFDNDPIYEEAMRLGREYRESLRPKAVRRSSSNAKKKSVKGRRR
jgi:hypothetical protein